MRTTRGRGEERTEWRIAKLINAHSIYGIVRFDFTILSDFTEFGPILMRFDFFNPI